MDNKLISIGKVAKILGITTTTLRRWDKSGKLKSLRTPTGRRAYLLSEIEKMSMVSTFSIASGWLNNEKGVEPLENFYCQTGAVFQIRLIEMEGLLIALPGFEEKFSLIVAAVGEIGNNSFDHNLGNWRDVPGIFFSYDLDKKEIVLADRGQGVYKTLKRVKPEIADDKDALKVAFTEIISGRAPEERGNGLKFVRKVVALADMELQFQSGKAILNIERKSSELFIKKADNEIKGCLIRIKF
ncbi:MAG: hypothetical protein ACD_56C00036G0015 [uncultured bacterium]|nr:MAG: hypothetical protein ACD_56C00036G0015 [uncultured bacterium]